MLFQKYVRSNRKPKNTQKNIDSGETLAEHFPQGFFVVFVFLVFLFFVFLFFLFFSVFLFNCAKSFLVEPWENKRMQKVDLGGASIYLSIYIYIYTFIWHYLKISPWHSSLSRDLFLYPFVLHVYTSKLLLHTLSSTYIFCLNSLYYVPQTHYPIEDGSLVTHATSCNARMQ